MTAKLVQAERNTKWKTKFFIFISEAQPNLSKISASREKNAIKRDKAELAQRLASVSILYKYQIYLSISEEQSNLFKFNSFYQILQNNYYQLYHFFALISIVFHEICVFL